MRVLLVDDNRLMLEGLNNLLEAHGIRVAGTALDGLQAAKSAQTLKPDLILMDIRMPACDGLEATRRIKARQPEIKIVMLTTSAEDEDLFEAIKSGASGYLIKNMSSEAFIEALRALEQGVPPFSPGLAAKLLAEFARLAGKEAEMGGGKDMENREGLTERQTEVLRLVAAGLAYKEVAQKLEISERTVRFHMTEIMERLHLENRAQVLSYASKLLD